MKKDLQVDISSLTQPQKKMCLQLLAQSQVNFSKKENKYMAQLKINSSIDLKELLFSLESNKTVPQQTKSSKPLNHKTIKQKVNPIVPQKSHSLYPQGKKPINRAVKIQNFPKIQELHKHVQLYLHPKRKSFENLIDNIENIYEAYWAQSQYQNTNKVKSKNQTHKSCQIPLKSLPKFVYEYLMNSPKEKIKAQQNLLNFIESINYYCHRSSSIKLFIQFLKEQFNNDVFTYFLVLRSLAIELLNFNSKSHGIAMEKFINGLKCNRYEKEVQESFIKEFFKISSCNFQLKSNSQESQSLEFEQLTKLMYYNVQRKKNCVELYVMIKFMLQQFDKFNTHEYNLELSYSYNDSTLNELLFNDHSGNNPNISLSPYKQSLNTHFEIKMQEKPQIEYQIQQMRKNKTVEQLLKNKIQKKTKIMCQQTNSNEDYMVRTIEKLFDSIVKSDKNMYFETLRKTNEDEKQLLYVEKLQQNYQKIKNGIPIQQNFLREFFMGPGIRELFIKNMI